MTTATDGHYEQIVADALRQISEVTKVAQGALSRVIANEKAIRLEIQNAALLEALDKILRLQAESPLEACAYQGPPPKKWLREVAPALEARYKAVREAQAIARAAIALAKEETE